MASKLIGYVRVSTSGQDYERQVADVLSAGVRRDDLYADRVSGSRSSRPGLDAALGALQEGDTLVVCTLDRLGRNVPHMLKMADELQRRNVELRVLNLGGGVVDTATPTGRLMFTVMAALAEMEYNIKAERNRDSVAKRRAKRTVARWTPSCDRRRRLLWDYARHRIRHVGSGGVPPSERGEVHFLPRAGGARKLGGLLPTFARTVRPPFEAFDEDARNMPVNAQPCQCARQAGKWQGVEWGVVGCLDMNLARNHEQRDDCDVAR